MIGIINAKCTEIRNCQVPSGRNDVSNNSTCCNISQMSEIDNNAKIRIKVITL